MEKLTINTDYLKAERKVIRDRIRSITFKISNDLHQISELEAHLRTLYPPKQYNPEFTPSEQKLWGYIQEGIINSIPPRITRAQLCQGIWGERTPPLSSLSIKFQSTIKKAIDKGLIKAEKIKGVWHYELLEQPE